MSASPDPQAAAADPGASVRCTVEAERSADVPSRRPELLAPAGNWECARAAVANGADAVYFGLPVLNARLRADNFREEELPELVRFLHEHRRRAYVALNTLVFTDELPEAERIVRLVVASRADAVIVQDLGLAVLAGEMAPELEVHASTQMTITSPEGVRFARKLGVRRVILARELSLAEIAKCRGPDLLPLEVFVHGALCVAYSGQCLTSESLGQRSANRGECAQACRMQYELMVDGAVRELGERRFLLSPQDLAAVREVPELIRLGVASLKIEGRLKSPEYVAAVTQVYRKAIDTALADGAASPPSDDDYYRLEMTFSRGLFSGWFHGVNHQKLVHALHGTKRGPFAGRVLRSGRDSVELDADLRTRLARGDGVVFDTGGDTDREQGGRLFDVRGRKLYFQRGHIDFETVPPGTRVWKTSDPKLERELRRSFARPLPPVRAALDLVVRGKEDEPLRLEGRGGGVSAEVASTVPLEAAAKRPLDVAYLRAQLGRLGGTRWELRELETRLEGSVIVPVSELNRLRRELVARMDGLVDASANQARGAEAARTLAEVLAAFVPRSLEDSVPQQVELIVLCRTLDQIEAALAAEIQTLYCDFEDPRRYKDAVRRVRDAGAARVYLATPRIQKAGEVGLFRPIELAEPDGVLVRNLGALDYFRLSPLRRVGDFSLNVANPLSAAVLMEEGFERLTVSYDLSAEQVLDLAGAAPPRWFEVTIHQHMPMFHMEHCVFAAFLSNGTDATNCGRPCDRHKVHVRDRMGVAHPVTADVGCRNTVFNAAAQSGAYYLRRFLAAGLRRFRVELLDEDGEKSRRIIDAYRELLAGKTDTAALVRRLQVEERLGVTRGTLATAR